MSPRKSHVRRLTPVDPPEDSAATLFLTAAVFILVFCLAFILLPALVS